jgi:type I restriction enzyme S subunit
MARPDRHIITRWQVLISGAGTLGENELYGRSIIADSRLIGRYVGPHAMVLSFADPGSDDNLFAYAFLCSRPGIQAIRSTSFGTKILGLRKELLGELPIPASDEPTKYAVASLVRQCVSQREAYIRELNAARSVLEALPEMREAHGMSAERRAHCVTWKGDLPTLSAWTYASTGGALEYLQNKWNTRLGDVIEPNGLYNGPRFARVNCEAPHGVEFMSQRDAFLIRPAPRRIVHPGFEDRLLFARRGTVMIGGHGTLGEGEIFGKAMFVHDRFAKSAFTQDLLRLVPRSGNEELMYTFCTTLVGTRLFRSTAVGTKILSMRPDLLRQLPFPEVDKLTAKRITHHVVSAIAAREEADTAEAEAIRIIEEEVLPAWLA